MKESRTVTGLLGILTIVPIVYFVAFCVFLMPKLSSFQRLGNINREQYFESFNVVYRLHVATLLLSIVLLGIYVVLAYRTKVMPAAKKWCWIAFLLVGNILAMPIFWYCYIWRSQVPMVLTGPKSS